LEQVWAAVSKEALSMIFKGADTSRLEADARVTAIWLWTLASPGGEDVGDEDDGDGQGSLEDDVREDAPSVKSSASYELEFDAARKISLGLGADLAELGRIVEVKGPKARLFGISERVGLLFSKVDAAARKKPARRVQISIFGDETDCTVDHKFWGELGAPLSSGAGEDITTLDRVHQAMLIFGSGNVEGLKIFIVEEGIDKQPQFWSLAQSLSALYPGGSREKRWVDGVLGRKKLFGFG